VARRLFKTKRFNKITRNETNAAAGTIFTLVQYMVVSSCRGVGSNADWVKKRLEELFRNLAVLVFRADPEKPVKIRLFKDQVYFRWH
jgi:hypothetical protein